MTDEASREEFFNEAQELIESFSRALLSLDASVKEGKQRPDLINESFRAIHTLKGLSGLFGATALSALTHQLEDLLDAVRLGNLELSGELLDVLFSAVEGSHQLLRAERLQPGIELQQVEGLNEIVAAIAAQFAPPESKPKSEHQIEEGILSVLTEYEEHRLRTNLDAGLQLFRIRAQFDLMTIDSELSSLKEKARPLGEVITYLPTGESSSPDVLELDLLLATGEAVQTLTSVLGSDIIKIELIPTARMTHPPEAAVELLPQDKPALSPSESAELSPHQDFEAGEGADASLVQRSVRVDIRKLDRLMNIVGELSLLKGSLQKSSSEVQSSGARRIARDLNRLHRNLERRLADLQDGILEMRMVPLGQVFDRLARGVRQVSRELDKEVRLVITGSETEIDKLIVEELGEPLMHMLRNAMDHGLESEAERLEVGKSSAGTIALNAYQKGNHVMIEVEDDGRGIHEERLRQRAIALGAIDADDELSHDEIIGLMFLPGISTSTEVSNISGRGVGMDVVKTNIARLGGVIDVQSEPGIGTKMTLTLPITLSIVRALLVRVASQTFALPIASVTEVVPLRGSTRQIEGREVMSLRGASLPLCRLEEHFGLIDTAGPPGQQLVALAQVGERRLGLVVDSIVGQQDIVIKNLSDALKAVRGFSGATELGDQHVALVLDAASIVEEVMGLSEGIRQVVDRG